MAATHTSKAKSTRFKAIVERTRRLLIKSEAGANGIRALSRSLGIAEDSGGLNIEKLKFVEILGNNGVCLDEDDIEAIMYILDRNGEGMIDPVDFIAALRRELTPMKRTWIIRLWYMFNQNKDGTILIDELLGAFNPSGHPEVVCGKRSEKDVLEEFQATFNSTTNPDGVLTRQEFEQYYSCVAGYCPDDISFITLLRGVWPNISGVPDEKSLILAIESNKCNTTFKASQTASEKKIVNKIRQHAADLDELILNIHRPTIMVSSLAIRQLSLSLREKDTERIFFLSKDTFLEALWKQRLYITNSEELLPVLDTRGDGSVDYMLYMIMLIPPLQPARLMMLERLWDLFQKDRCGTVDIMEFHKRFRAKDGEEKNLFLGAWDVRRAIQRRVSMEELVEWYTPMSVNIELDKDFDLMIKRQWNFA